MAKLKRTPNGLSLKERLAYRSKPGANGCIDFVGATNQDGYGYIRDPASGKMIYAHRASWAAHKGPIPLKRQVRHKCDRPICINIKHLRLGTHIDNMRDRTIRERGHLNKLTAEKVRRIRADKRLQRVIAADYAIDQRTVSQIKRRKTWKHLG